MTVALLIIVFWLILVYESYGLPGINRPLNSAILIFSPNLKVRLVVIRLLCLRLRSRSDVAVVDSCDGSEEDELSSPILTHLVELIPIIDLIQWLLFHPSDVESVDERQRFEWPNKPIM